MSPIAFDISVNDTPSFQVGDHIGGSAKEVEMARDSRLVSKNDASQDIEANEECVTIGSDTEESNEYSLEERILIENEDYEMVLRAYNVLKYQLQKAREDINKLKILKEKALRDPIQFARDLRDRKNEPIPRCQYIVGIPRIDWSRYHTNPLEYKARLDKEAAENLKNNPLESRSNRDESPDLTEMVHKKAQELGFKVPPNAILSTRSKKRNDRDSDDEYNYMYSSKILNWKARESCKKSSLSGSSGRANSSKVTNGSSSVGNPTGETNCNLKMKSNEPKTIDGSPKNSTNNLSWTNEEQSSASSPKNTISKNKRTNKVAKNKIPPEKRIRRPRVSGIAYMEAQPPPTLYMPDDDDESSIKNVMMMSFDKDDQMQDVEMTPSCENDGPIHHGYCCDSCHKDPIIGTRFLCMDCDESREVDLCEKCMVEGNFENDNHKKIHRFSVITSPVSQHFDVDYVPERVGEYNYLGPAP
ncbi:529_t:CDS:10 [Diversispora eburnea]|uniref:529_t:CDS:1 n=1 Tax=Diversispora eburnea TaxID=1213867 RepID=A0A9N9B058_9GLOM|nr:529_t:CDS:10 [Diversispora eburnea]